MTTEVKNGRNRPATSKQTRYVHHLVERLGLGEAREVGEALFGYDVCGENKGGNLTGTRERAYFHCLNAQGASDFIGKLKEALGEEDSPRPTTRERREARAEKRREWAGSRAQKAEATSEAARESVAGIPMGQPILAGHHSQRRHERDIERSNSKTRQSIEHADAAKRHAEAADTIEGQLERSVFDDDPDAIERLTERIEAGEAKRARIKAYNASCRKGERDVSLLGEAEKKDLATTARVCPYQLGKKGEAPRHWLTNLGGTINKDKKRREKLEARAA